LLALVGNGTISGSIAKQVLEKMLETGDGAPPSSSAKASSRPDTGAIEAAVATIMANNADKVEQYRGRQGSAFRLLRGPDDEGDGGQGQPADRQRTGEEGSGLNHLTAIACLP
jgi:aspartyl-tRNA(Asn)/glutamyl-tRNA(Gln) amidotransferase subunit B